jgi:HK97 family phage major capsid protein
VVEKILQRRESLPASWPVAGTVGYKFVTNASENASIGITRVPVEVIGRWSLDPDWWVGAGVVMHNSVNIEGDDFIQTVLDLAAGRAAIDLEKLLINGDTASPDTFLALQDGILKRLTANVVDAGASTLNASLCQNILLALPNKYRRERAGLRWILHPDDQERLIGSISARQTALGDGMLTGDAPLKLSKIIAEQAGYMPDGVALLGNPKNIVMGIRRKFTLESERLISRRMIRFVLTARVAIGIEDDEAMVKATGIDAA